MTLRPKDRQTPPLFKKGAEWDQINPHPSSNPLDRGIVVAERKKKGINVTSGSCKSTQLGLLSGNLIMDPEGSRTSSSGRISPESTFIRVLDEGTKARIVQL
ncbi:hypothetical protein CEXT_319901 [Caerostris extrusa]|uniref:Uncharacterized protein n=1 Tax=Caerostris extrusa TaxID=172846 RepID=A0AAV4YEU3_CAEEX|nr:hypothetical protein CEXT_319901 [Caerostris extrusa]